MRTANASTGSIGPIVRRSPIPPSGPPLPSKIWSSRCGADCKPRVTWDSSGPRRSSIPSGPMGSHHCLRSGPSTASSGVGACWTGGIGSGDLLRLRAGICRRWPAAVGNSTASISSRDWSFAAAPRSRSSTASRSMAAWSRPGLVGSASRRSSWSSAWSSIGGSSACRATPSSTRVQSRQCHRLRDLFGLILPGTPLSPHFGKNLRLQVCLIHLRPDSAQLDHAQVHDPLTSFQFPGHPRLFQPLREHRLARRLGHPAADREEVVSVLTVIQELNPLPHVVVSVVVPLPLLPHHHPLPPDRRRRVQHPVDPPRFLLQ